jgi:hypothetical protein
MHCCALEGGAPARGFLSAAAIGHGRFRGMAEIRKGQFPGKLSRAQFGERYRQAFADPAFDGERPAIGRLEEIAWGAYEEGRKAPVTRKIGAAPSRTPSMSCGPAGWRACSLAWNAPG